MELVLTEEEMKLISHISMDEESGRYLLESRTKEYNEMAMRLAYARAKADNIRTFKENQMLEYLLACKDFDLYQMFLRKYNIHTNEHTNINESL